MNIQDYSKLLLGYYYCSSTRLPSSLLNGSSSSKSQVESKLAKYEYDNLLLEFLTDDGTEIDEYQENKSFDNFVPKNKPNYRAALTTQDESDSLSISIEPLNSILPSSGDDIYKIAHEFDSSLKVVPFDRGLVLSIDKIIYLFSVTKYEKYTLSKIIELTYDIDIIEVVEYSKSTPFLYIFTKQLKLIVISLNTGHVISSLSIPFRCINVSFHRLNNRLVGTCFVSSTCIYLITHFFEKDYSINISQLFYFDYPIIGSLALIDPKSNQTSENHTKILFLFVSSSGNCFMRDYAFTECSLSKSHAEAFTMSNVSQFGKICKVVQIDQDQNLILFKRGWCVCYYSEGTINDSISSPLPASFDDIFVYEDTQRASFCITMTDGSAMLVNDGAVRLVDYQGKVLGISSIGTPQFINITDNGLLVAPILSNEVAATYFVYFVGNTDNKITCNLSRDLVVQAHSNLISIHKGDKELSFQKIFEVNIKTMFKINDEFLVCMDGKNQICIVSIGLNYELKSKINLHLHCTFPSNLNIYFVETNNFLEIIYNDEQFLRGELQCVVDLSSLNVVHHDRKNLQLSSQKLILFTSSNSPLKAIQETAINELTEIEEKFSKNPDFEWLTLSTGNIRVNSKFQTDTCCLPLLAEIILLRSDSKDIQNRFFEYASENFDPFYLFHDLARVCCFKERTISDTAFSLLSGLISGIGSNIREVIKVWKMILNMNGNALKIESCIILGLIVSSYDHSIQRGLRDQVMKQIIEVLTNYKIDENSAVQIIKLLNNMIPNLLNFENNLLNPLYLILSILKINTNELTESLASAKCTEFLDKCFETDKEYMTIVMSYIVACTPSYANMVTVHNKTGTSTEQYHDNSHSLHLPHKGELSMKFTEMEVELTWKITLLNYINYRLIVNPGDVSVAGIFLFLNSLFMFDNELIKHPRDHTLTPIMIEKIEATLDLTCSILKLRMSKVLSIYDRSINNIFGTSKLGSKRNYFYGRTMSSGDNVTVFISVDRNYLKDVQYSGALYTFLNNTWILYLLKSPDLAEHTLSNADQSAIATLHIIGGTLPYITGAKFSSDGQFVSGLNLETFSIIIWHTVPSKLREGSTPESRLVSSTDSVSFENPNDFSIDFVRSFWQQISTPENRGSKRLEQTLRYMSKQAYNKHSPIIQPSKQICFAEIMLKYFFVYKNNGIPIGLEDINIEWLQNDRIALRIGNKVIFVYSL